MEYQGPPIVPKPEKPRAKPTDMAEVYNEMMSRKREITTEYMGAIHSGIEIFHDRLKNRCTGMLGFLSSGETDAREYFARFENITTIYQNFHCYMNLKTVQFHQEVAQCLMTLTKMSLSSVMKSILELMVEGVGNIYTIFMNQKTQYVRNGNVLFPTFVDAVATTQRIGDALDHLLFKLVRNLRHAESILVGSMTPVSTYLLNVQRAQTRLFLDVPHAAGVTVAINRSGVPGEIHRVVASIGRQTPWGDGDGAHGRKRKRAANGDVEQCPTKKARHSSLIV